MNIRQRGMEHNVQKLGFVFIHGAGLAGSIWQQVADELGYPSLLLDFPGRMDDDPARKQLTLVDYVSCMNEQIHNWPIHRFVLVAHSIGGVVALPLAARWQTRTAGLVAVGAVVPKPGGSFLSALPFPKNVVMSAIMRTAGTRPPDAAIRSGLCHDLTTRQADQVVQGFKPESYRLYSDRIDAPVPDVPKLYVKLTADKELPASLQDRMIARLSPQSVQSLHTGHLPMLANPGRLRQLLRHFAAEYE